MIFLVVYDKNKMGKIHRQEALIRRNTKSKSKKQNLKNAIL